MKKWKVASILISVGLVLFPLIDPVFEREVSYGEYSVKYEWRVFNNAFCNLKTAGHCRTNKISKSIAENELYRKLLDGYSGEKVIEQKLIYVVNSTYRYDMIYRELTNTSVVQIDSLKKYKELIFRGLYLK